jgi:hypothetical protein
MSRSKVKCKDVYSVVKLTWFSLSSPNEASFSEFAYTSHLY